MTEKSMVNIHLEQITLSELCGIITCDRGHVMPSIRLYKASLHWGFSVFLVEVAAWRSNSDERKQCLGGRMRKSKIVCPDSESFYRSARQW